MIPPYGAQHRPVEVPPTWYPISAPRWPPRLGRLGRRCRDRVCVDTDRQVLDIRYGRWRMTALLADIADVHVSASGPARPVFGFPRSGRLDVLRLGARTARAARIRLRRPMPRIHATGLRGRPAVQVTVTVPDADRLVRQLRRYVSSTSINR